MARILVSEASSLSALESIHALVAAGHHVEACDSSALCLARFATGLRRVHRCPHFGRSPAAYLAFVVELLERRTFDVLYPAHEQAFLFARARARLERHVALALPDFEVMRRLQSKVELARTLDALGLPCPETAVVNTPAALRAACTQAAPWVKTAIGTASRGVLRVDSAEALAHAVTLLGGSGPLVVQRHVDGALERAQAIFDHGRLCAFHACRQLAVAVGGGDVQKEAVHRPLVQQHLAQLGAALGWHGGLSIDYLLTPQGSPSYVDANPRLAEPGNAVASGLNLPALLVELSLGHRLAPGTQLGRCGTRTHMGLQAVLSAAQERRPRRRLLRTLSELWGSTGRFAGSHESLTPRAEPALLVPFVAVSALLLALPWAWRWLVGHAVGSYALTESGAALIEAGEL
ncbi:MAG: ATP-grasp domain-containing protein [Archangiaceae bacterium]|nr:ATP-grasp domain-containing protein [Archangiaceae bacterium]